jgi:F0F1-type ATP synthase membrane subunit b/b'
MSSLAISFFNFLILLGILFYQLRKPAQEFVVNRHKTLREEIQSVRAQLQSAQEQYDDFSSKLKALSSEVAVLNEQSQQDAAAMTQRIMGEGRQLASLIVSDARGAAENLFADFKRDLYNELSASVLSRAEAVVKTRLTNDDQARIQKEFSQQVGESNERG